MVELFRIRTSTARTFRWLRVLAGIEGRFNGSGGLVPRSLNVVLISPFLITNDVEYFFMCLWAFINSHFLCKIPVQIFPPLKNIECFVCFVLSWGSFFLNTGPLTDTYFGVCDFNRRRVRGEELHGAQTALSGVGGTWGWRSRSLLPLPRSCPRLGGRQAEKCPARSGRNRRRGVGRGRGEKLQGAKRGRPRPSPGPASVHAEVPRTLSRCALQTRGL